MIETPDLENPGAHSTSKNSGDSLARRYHIYKVITCAIGITLVLVVLLGCGMGSEEDHRRLSPTIHQPIRMQNVPQNTYQKPRNTTCWAAWWRSYKYKPSWLNFLIGPRLCPFYFW